jgi:hypothetical protein
VKNNRMITTITGSVIVLFSLVALIGLAYADAPETVEVNEFPFNVTILKGGSLTLTSNDALDRNFTAQIGNNAFNQVLRSGESITMVIPDYMTTDNPDGWYLQDTITGEWSVILVKEPYVEPPEPVYVAPVVVEPTPEVIVEEQVSFSATSSETTGIFNVNTYDGDVDLVTIQAQLAEVTSKFNLSVEKITEQRLEIQSLSNKVVGLQSNVTSLMSQPIMQVDTTELDNKVLQLQANNTNLSQTVTNLSDDRDKWKALAENWYGVAMAQLKVMVNILGL